MFDCKSFQIDRTDKYGRTFLHFAISGAHKKAIEMLVERGLNVNAKDIKKMTPLHYIAYYNAERRDREGQENWTEDDDLSNVHFRLCIFNW